MGWTKKTAFGNASADNLGRGIALRDICRRSVPFGDWRGAVVGGMS